jgi:transposase
MAQTKECQSSRSIHSLTPVAYPLDSTAYKRRNLIERMFCKLNNWRRIATRYDRYEQNYLSGLALAAIMNRMDLNESPT